MSGVQIAALLAVVFSSGACTPPLERPRPANQKRSGPASTEPLAIRQQVERLSAAVDTSNSEEFASLFAPDAVFMPYNQKHVAGRQAIRTWAQEMFVLYDYDKTAIHLDYVEVIDTWAFVRGSYAQNLFPRSGGPVLHATGSFVHTLQRQEDGSWLLSNTIWSNSSPLPQLP